jgi:hypothetical protein
MAIRKDVFVDINKIGLFKIYSRNITELTEKTFSTSSKKLNSLFKKILPISSTLKKIRVTNKSVMIFDLFE